MAVDIGEETTEGSRTTERREHWAVGGRGNAVESIQTRIAEIEKTPVCNTNVLGPERSHPARS